MSPRIERFFEGVSAAAVAIAFVVSVYWVYTAGMPQDPVLARLGVYGDTADAPSPLDRRVTIDFLWPTYTPQKVRYGQYLARQYMEEHPDVYVNLMLTPDPYPKLQVMIAGRTTPDVVWQGVGWQQFASAFMPLEERVAASSMIQPEAFFPSLWAACHWRGALLVLPSSSQVGVIYYNKDLFDEAGLSYPTNDWTWEEMVRAGRALTRDFDGDGFTDQYGVQLEYLFRIPFLLYDGQMADPEWQEARIHTPLRLAIMEDYRDLIYKEGIMPTPIAAAELGMLPMFEAGRIGMFASSGYALESFRKVQFDWDVVPLPWYEFEGERYRATGVWQEEFAVMWDTDIPDEAFAFASWCASKEVIAWAAENGHIVPGRIDVAESTAFKDPNKRPANMDAFVESIGFGIPVYPHPAMREMTRRLEPVWQRFMVGVEGARIPVDQALREMDTVLQDILDAYNAEYGRR